MGLVCPRLKDALKTPSSQMCIALGWSSVGGRVGVKHGSGSFGHCSASSTQHLPSHKHWQSAGHPWYRQCAGSIFASTGGEKAPQAFVFCFPPPAWWPHACSFPLFPF